MKHSERHGTQNVSGGNGLLKCRSVNDGITAHLRIGMSVTMETSDSTHTGKKDAGNCSGELVC